MRHRSGKDFPLPCPRVAAPGRFRLNGSKTERSYPDRHLVRTAILRISQSPEQPRRFPQQSNRFLAFFADRISNSNITALLADKAMPEPLSFISTQGRLLCPQHYKGTAWQVYSCAVLPSVAHKGRAEREARTQVSTEKGSTLACHCESPLNLNPQHKPPTGRRKPTPGTSSICPSTDF